MQKEEIVKRYGEAVYKTRLQQGREWHAEHRDIHNAENREWATNNPSKAKAISRERGCKGGKHYEKMLKYQRTGIPGERHIIRATHGRQYRPYKQIIAPNSAIHHEWIPDTADFRGVALVETDQHMHGFVDVIKILEGKITLLSEKEIKG